MPAPIIVADTSVLINFLKISRMDLIGRYPGRFLATDHVESELADDYPEQRARYQAARSPPICSTHVPSPILRKLNSSNGSDRAYVWGECSAIAVALSRGYAIAIDDGRAIKAAHREAELARVSLTVLRTRDIMVGLIQASVLSIEEADQIKADWETNHQFQLKERTFRDLV